MSAITGIDVSKHQGAINWKSVKESGVNFAILRAGYGRVITQKDPTFETNYKDAKAAGLPVGAYWYSYAKNKTEAIEEAKVCLEVIKGKQFEYPIYFDIEENDVLRLGMDTVSTITKAFLETVEKAGYFVGIYSSKSHLENYIEKSLRTRYTVWVAHYGVSKTTYKDPYDMWQRSSVGKVRGVNGAVDMDECYVDFPTRIKNKGLNGFSKPITKQPENKIPTITKTIDELAQEVIDGKWGNGSDRKANLTNAGYDYKKVQERVNQLVYPKTEPRYHTVVKGDNLTTIANKYGTTVDTIVSENRATYPRITGNYIQVGWKLKV